MRLFFTGLAALSILVATSLPGQSSAQTQERMSPVRDAEATIYRDPNFQGPAMAVQRAQPDLRLAWPVYSVRVARGAWQLCSAPNFQGNCVTVTRNEPNISGRFGRGNVLRSIRPISNGPGGPVVGNPGQSLRGMAAEFYPKPMDGRSRVLACQRGSATANCAAQTADQFCRAHGWTASAREAMETEARRVYLADVLCTRTGR